MTDRHPVCELEQLAQLKNGRGLPPEEYTPNGQFRVFGSNGQIAWTTRFNTSEPSVVIGRVGAYCGSLHFSRTAAWITDNAIIATARDGVDLTFLYYCLTSMDLRQAATGSAQPLVTQSSLRGLPARYPPLPEQRAIASVLGALDDKIDLNRRMNETLEELARTIFKSWFVDFDPVKAKAEGREPEGMDAETAALFPSRFVESELGMIPEGWETTSLGKLCEDSGGDIQTGPFGSQLHASDYVEEGIPSVMPKDLSEDRISCSSIARIRVQDAERLSRYRLRAGDIVYSRRGDVERCALVTFREDGWLCGTGCLRVRPGPRRVEPAYLFAMVTTNQARSWVVRHAHGATMPNLNTQILGELPLLDVPHSAQRAYSEIAAPLQDRRNHNWSENETLAEIRDLLLPKLISGELRIPDAEKLAESVL